MKKVDYEQLKTEYDTLYLSWCETGDENQKLKEELKDCDKHRHNYKARVAELEVENSLLESKIDELKENLANKEAGVPWMQGPADFENVVAKQMEMLHWEVFPRISPELQREIRLCITDIELAALKVIHKKNDFKAIRDEIAKQFFETISNQETNLAAINDLYEEAKKQLNLCQQEQRRLRQVLHNTISELKREDKAITALQQEAQMNEFKQRLDDAQSGEER